MRESFEKTNDRLMSNPREDGDLPQLGGVLRVK